MPVTTSLTVSNTPPEAPVVSIDPATNSDGDDLLRLMDTDAIDADGDSISYTIAWTVDGLAHHDAVGDGAAIEKITIAVERVVQLQ